MNSFWKTYLTDWLNIGVSLVVITICLVINHYVKLLPSPAAFVVGYILTNIVWYYFGQYRPDKKVYDAVQQCLAEEKEKQNSLDI